VKYFFLFYVSATCIDLFQSEVEETLKRIQSHRGVVGIMIVNNEGKIFGIYCSKWVITLISDFMDTSIRVNRAFIHVSALFCIWVVRLFI